MKLPSPMPHTKPTLAGQPAWMAVGLVALSGVCLLITADHRAALLAAVVPALSLAAAWLHLLRARRGAPGRWFFLFIGAALGLHGALDILRLFARHGVPILRLGFGANLAISVLGPVLQGVAVLSWPTTSRGPGVRWREILDALLFTTSIFLVFWLLGLGDLMSDTPVPVREKIAQMVFFLDYTLLMGLAIYRGLNAPGRFHSPLGWVLGAFLIASLGNLAWISLQLRGRYTPGHPLDIIILLLLLFYLIAAKAPVPPAPVEGAGGSRLGAWMNLALPYLPFLFAIPLTLHQLLWHATPRDTATLWLGMGMVVLLLLRQMLALMDAQRLSRNLEAEVRQRTLALEESQAMLLRTQKLNILATLGAGLVHDLKNLMTVVMASTDLLQEDLAAAPGPVQSTLEMLRKASVQASELMTKLMSFGREEAPRSEVFDLRERVQGMARLLGNLATPAVAIQWDLGPTPILVRMDPTQVEQILVNLVANARDATPGRGVIRIAARTCSTEEGLRASLSVTDSGVGIPEAELNRLFQAFYTTKAAGSGTGLGLASVKAIVDSCGGKVAVESHLRVGTTFTIHLPCLG